jgi:predicted oxidoreductase
MRYNQLGNTGLFVSEICLGTMTFGAAGSGIWGGIADVDQDAADRIVERSLAAGVNFIDTADVYSFGDSERLLGQALHNLGIARKDVVIATKVYGQMGEGPNDRGASRGHIMDSVEASLDLRRACPLRRRLQLAGLEDRQGARRVRAQGVCPLRDAAGLLFDRRARSGARDRASAQ